MKVNHSQDRLKCPICDRDNLVVFRHCPGCKTDLIAHGHAALATHPDATEAETESTRSFLQFHEDYDRGAQDAE